MTSKPQRPIALASKIPVDTALPIGTHVPRQVISKDKWEEIKPVIHRLYIVEHKAFSKIKPIIAEKYGFTPTSSQFGKRVNKWGFKKNASRDQRLKIVHGLGFADQGRLGPNGKVVRQSTRERWEKEFQKDPESVDQPNFQLGEFRILYVILPCLSY